MTVSITPDTKNTVTITNDARAATTFGDHPETFGSNPNTFGSPGLGLNIDTKSTVTITNDSK